MSEALLSDTKRREWQDALADAGEGHPPNSDCPPAEQIWRAARGELDGSEMRQVLDHASGCPGCSLAWRLAVEVDIGKASTGVEATTRTQRHWRWMLAAAAIVVGLAVLAPFVLQREPTSDEVREAPGDVIRSLVEGHTLERNDCVLRWTPIDGTTTYSVLVGSEDLDVLARAVGLVSPELRVPPESLSPLPDGASLVWRVEARLEDGSRVSSPSFVNPVR